MNTALSVSDENKSHSRMPRDGSGILVFCNFFGVRATNMSTYNRNTLKSQ